MINTPIGIIAALLSIEAFVFYLSEKKETKKFFKYLPSVFWIYFLPMLASTFKIIPQNNKVYSYISSNFLPASLILLLISANLKKIFKLGRIALIMMFAGSFGIMLGGPIVILLFKKWLPENIWMGFGALAGSWTGGSANMIAVKEGIGTPDKIFLPMVVVDTIVAYSWMGILIAIAAYQKKYDNWNKSDKNLLTKFNGELVNAAQKESSPLSLKYMGIIAAIALIGAFLSLRLGEILPEIKNAISASTWAIIIASTIGIILSLTSVKKLEFRGAPQIGYLILYFVLASIGARASLNDILYTPILIVAGFVWVIIHAAFVFLVSRIFKAPMFLMAAASQANIGGTASAPVVAEIYQTGLAPVGLLLAIVGNIIGTYCGIICAQLCRLVS